MDVHDKRIIHSSLESNWRTPQDCFDKLDLEFGFCLDAAADNESRLCSWWLGPGSELGEDALTADWQFALQRARSHWGEAIFINPPFSKTLRNKYKAQPELARVYDIGAWAFKCWEESQKGCTIVGIFPFAPQTNWYRRYVYGHASGGKWCGHAAREERRLPHRISFLQPDGSPAGNAGVNSVILVWQPNCGIVGPWTPWTCYWSYRGE